MIAGHYRLVEYIGSGAMGVVWRAVDVRLERSVAVKKVMGQHGMSEADRADLRRRAMREAKIAARLQHPNAIVVYDIAEHEGDTCLVMEYLPSRSLADLIAERGTLPVPEVARIGEQVASALIAAHQAGIVHRDVKPGNILIDPSGVAKLTDFGISRAQGDITLTATGLVGGTPAYIAPELARGADPAPPSDVFALGATLYCAIEGRSPYGDNQNQLALLHTAASGKIVPPTRAGAATSLLNSLLRVDPGERPSMKQAGERLAAIASGGGVPAPPTPILPASPPKGGTRLLAPWQRTKVAEQPSRTPAATTRATQPAATAMYSAVDYQDPGRARPSKKTPPSRSAKRSGNRGLIAGLAGFAALLAVAVFLLVNPADSPKPAAEPDRAPGSSAPKDPTSSTSADNGGGRIQFQPAGQLVVDYYSFPQGMDASWSMLTPGAQQVFGEKEKFEKYWSKFDAVWAKSARGFYNDDGSVTITATMVIQKGGKEHNEPVSLRVVRAGGDLRIDSDTR